MLVTQCYGDNVIIEMAGVVYVLKEVYGYIKDGKEILDTARSGYNAVKDVEGYFDIKDGEPKLVDFAWPAKSGFQQQAAEQGVTVVWARPDTVASRELDGYDVMFEIDSTKKVKRRLVLHDGLTLMGRKAA